MLQSQLFVGSQPAPQLPVRSPIPALARRISAIVAAHGQDEAAICVWVSKALAEVVLNPDWIPYALRRPSAAGYRRELLHEAEDGSFSIGCFIWGPYQQTPIHDHRCWGVMGVAFGAVESVSFYPVQSGMLVPGPAEIVPAGFCAWVHPEGGDIHRVGAAGAETSISIHVYGTRFAKVCRNRYLPDGAILSQ
jgi:predicted metal-dependent enzyme (double-stranded beta helix superfamily)